MNLVEMAAACGELASPYHLQDHPNDHVRQLLSILKNFSKSDTLTDMTFVSISNRVSAHRHILSCFSPFLGSVIKSRSFRQSVLFSDDSVYVLKLLIDYIYSGSLAVPVNYVASFYKLAEDLKFEGFVNSHQQTCGSAIHFIWPKHHETLIASLWQARSDADQCDVIFVTNNYCRTHSHSSILAACSSLLLNIFVEFNKNNGKPFVFVLQNFEASDLEIVLQYCYKGVIQVPSERTEDICKLAKILGVEALCNKLLVTDQHLLERTSSSKNLLHDNQIVIKSTLCGIQENFPVNCHLNQFLKNIWEYEQFTDVTFVVGSKKYNAHSMVLSSFSEYFRCLCKHLQHSIKDAFILIRDFNYQHVEAFLDYVYKGEVLYNGSAEEFYQIMHGWIDFDAYPITSPTIQLENLDVEVSESAETSGKMELRMESSISEKQDNLNHTQQVNSVEATSCERVEKIESDCTMLNKEDEGDCNDDNDGIFTCEQDVNDDNEIEGKTCRKTHKFMCHTCQERFPSRQAFNKHLQIHPDGRIIRCKFCDKTFQKPSQLKLHVRSHTGVRPYGCSECGMTFPTNHGLNKHKRTHAKDKYSQFICDHCNKSFIRKEYLEEHIRTHTGSKPFKCPFCPKAFVGKTGLNHHKKIHASEEEKKSAICDVCGKHMTRHALWSHMKSHDRSYKCEMCPKVFATTTALKHHTAGMHLGHRSHQCDICGKGFVNKNHLQRHMQGHSKNNEREWFCEKCSKAFKSEEKLQSHKQNEHSEQGGKPYSCNICHKRFSGRSTVLYHKRNHTGEKPHVCQSCGKSFARPDALQQHMRAHNGEKMFECHICKKKCARKATLSKHLVSHQKEQVSKEGSYSCNECSKTFNSESQLLLHGKVHGCSRPYKCEVCRKTFRYADSLTKHTKIHTEASTVDTAVMNELPGIYSFQSFADLSVNSYSNNGQQFQISNDKMIALSLAPRRPYSITLDGNLCCNADALAAAELDILQPTHTELSTVPVAMEPTDLLPPPATYTTFPL